VERWGTQCSCVEIQGLFVQRWDRDRGAEMGNRGAEMGNRGAEIKMGQR